MSIRSGFACLAIAVATAPAFAGHVHATVGTGLIYQVIDADDDPYSGIYLRDDTRMDAVQRESHRYMLYGTSIELICGTNGEAVGPNANHRWHKVIVASGDTQGQVGWVADRYTNTPNNANEATPNEPECGVASSPQAAPVGVFLSPYNAGDGYEFAYSTNTVNFYESRWHRPESDCDSQFIYEAIKVAASGRPIDRLASWSLSKIAPMYYMYHATDPELQALNYVLMIDPGPNDQFPSCVDGAGGSFDAGTALVRWLQVNPRATFLVVAGTLTDATPGGVIQNSLFNDVRNASSGSDLRSRVGVCEYRLNHDPESFRYTEWYIERPFAPTGECPTLEGGTETLTPYAWNP